MQLFKLIFFLLNILCASLAYAEDQTEPGTSPATPTAVFTFSNAHHIQLRLLSEDELNSHDLWHRLRNGFTLDEMDSPLIAKHEQWYAHRPEYVARMMDRASLYLYHITREVERRGMPAEIALLPMIESAFNPGAYSTSNAAGLWQFIPSTGKHFGLEQNWWYDGRRDVVSATTSALDYLEKLHTLFGDWNLALAAYNCGEGFVQRSQERNRKKGLPVDYLSLNLPEETRNYLPKLLAIKNIVADPAHFGLELPSIANKPYFTEVHLDQHMDVKLVAKLADISSEEFIALNPARNRPVMLQNNSVSILLPVDKVETYQTNLGNYDKPLVNWQAYQTRNGERFDHLAPRFGLSVDSLKKVNGLPAQTHKSTGQTLLVPLNADENNTEFEAFNMHLHMVPKHAAPHAALRTAMQGKATDRRHVSLNTPHSRNSGSMKTKKGPKIAPKKHAPVKGGTKKSQPRRHSSR